MKISISWMVRTFWACMGFVFFITISALFGNTLVDSYGLITGMHHQVSLGLIVLIVLISCTEDFGMFFATLLATTAHFILVGNGLENLFLSVLYMVMTVISALYCVVGFVLADDSYDVHHSYGPYGSELSEPIWSSMPGVPTIPWFTSLAQLTVDVKENPRPGKRSVATGAAP